MTRFTITEFRKKYATEHACLDKIFQLRYGKLEACPECACPASFRRITTRRCYQCKHCYAQFYPTAGTPFEKTTTPLSDWFFVIYLFTTTRNGVAAKEIERQLGVTYKTAWRMGHQIRTLIGGIDSESLKGFVDIDESYIGGKFDNKSLSRRKEYYDRVKDLNVKTGRNSDGKTPILAMVQRNAGVVAYVLPKIRQTTIFQLITKHVAKGSIISTDESRLYDNLSDKLGFRHGQVNHSVEEYRKGVYCTNSVEGFFSQVKRTIGGTHIHVSEKYLQNYLNECSFRYSNRKNQSGMFDAIISKMQPVKDTNP